jgi:hypothetical protein
MLNHPLQESWHDIRHEAKLLKKQRRNLRACLILLAFAAVTHLATLYL